MENFGITDSLTSPIPMRLPAVILMASILSRKTLFSSRSAAVSKPVKPKSSARPITIASIVDRGETINQEGLREPENLSLRLSDPDSEALTIRNALQKARFSKTKAAEILGISRTTLWRKLKEIQ